MLSHLLYHASAALNPPAPDPTALAPITTLPHFSGVQNPAGETGFHFYVSFHCDLWLAQVMEDEEETVQTTALLLTCS